MTNRPYQIGIYLRCSSDSQDFAAQRVAIDRFIAEHQYRKRDIVWYEDHQSGTTLTRRGIARLSNDIGSGRVKHAVFFSVDRFARELLAINQLDAWTKAGCRLTFISDGIDVPAGPIGDVMVKLILAIKLAMGEAEKARIAERTRFGRIAAKARGVKFGAPVRVHPARVRELRRTMPARDVARKLKCSLASVYRICPAKEGHVASGGE